MQTKPRSLKRVRILKQANNKTRYKHAKPSQPICGMCGNRIIFFSQGKQAKTKRRPERPLPNLCSKCMRKVMLAKARNNITLSMKKYADLVKNIQREGKNQNLYVKLLGRDAGDIVEITKVIDDKFVEVQGTIRKKVRKVNRAHLEPLLVKNEDIIKKSEKVETKIRKKRGETMKKMKIIGIAGSPRKGNTEVMVRAALEGAKEAGAKTEIILIRELKLEMCDGCLQCDEMGKCHFDDGMNEINERLAGVDGFIIGTPARWSLLSGNLKVFLDRTNPLAVPERLKGKEAGIIAVGQSPEDEEEQSIKKAVDSVKNYCSNAGIDVIGMVLGFNAINEGDIEKNVKTLEDCKKQGKKLVEHLKGKTCGG